MRARHILQRLVDDAVDALNAAAAEANRQCPGAQLFLEAEGTLHAMKPEPEAHKMRDPTPRERQELIILSSSSRTRGVDVGAW